MGEKKFAFIKHQNADFNLINMTSQNIFLVPYNCVSPSAINNYLTSKG